MVCSVILTQDQVVELKVENVDKF